MALTKAFRTLNLEEPFIDLNIYIYMFVIMIDMTVIAVLNSD